MLAGMVDDTRDSRESKPMDWSMRLASLSLGPTNFESRGWRTRIGRFREQSTRWCSVNYHVNYH